MYGVWTKKNMMITLTLFRPGSHYIWFRSKFKSSLLKTAHFAAIIIFLNRPKDEQVLIIAETTNNNHNFSRIEGFWQCLTITIFPEGSKSQLSTKMFFFFTWQNSENYQLQEKPLCITEITGPQKGVRDREVSGIHTDHRISVKAELIYPILAIFGILKGPY